MFADIAAPIHAVTNLTQAHKHKFKWKQPQSDSFRALKKLLTTEPLLLKFPDDSEPLRLETDASKIGLGGVLFQEINGQRFNLYYHSQLTTKAEQHYDTIESEALAIYKCFERMRPYIQSRPIILFTDHCPLCSMMTKNVKNKRVDRIALLLQEYHIIQVIHVKGRHNCLPDYLSRNPIEVTDELMEIEYGLEVPEPHPHDGDRVSYGSTIADVVGVTTRSAAKKEQAQTTADQSETETEEETDDTDNRKPLE
ncbi:unnamed protein product, partial [Didymodactylos carnosus]